MDTSKVWQPRETSLVNIKVIELLEEEKIIAPTGKQSLIKFHVHLYVNQP